MVPLVVSNVRPSCSRRAVGRDGPFGPIPVGCPGFGGVPTPERRNGSGVQTYALVVGKRGPKLRATSAPGDGAFIFGEDHVTFRAFSISGLADRLSGPVFKLDRRVVDMTGIKGFYDFTLNWAPDDAPVDGRSGASIFTAVQEQLGLKLEARKIVFKILVVDHADRTPAGN